MTLPLVETLLLASAPIEKECAMKIVLIATAALAALAVPAYAAVCMFC